MIGCNCEVCRSEDPRDKRLRTSALITTDDGRNIAIDCGPDFRQQMLQHQIENLDAVVFTHEHKDHTGGLDDIRAFNFKHRKSMALYGTAQVFDAIRRQYDYIFSASVYPGLPQVSLNEIDGKNAFEVAGLSFLPIPLMHYHLPVLGFRVGDFAYVTDANEIEEEGMKRLQGIKSLVLNALRREKHISHFSLSEALDVVAEIAPEQAYFTHISHQMGLHAQVDAMLPNGVSLGFDGVKLYI